VKSAKPLEVPPRASALMESMRGSGYSLETALADVIDNSLSAEAKRIAISAGQNEYGTFISIQDDGLGMTASEVIEALRFGGRGPHVERSPNDLGRFGLGLKTASLSQCRRLTVASKRDGVTSCYRWDLDYLQQHPDVWELLIGPAVGSEAHLEGLNNQPSGTTVLWELVDFGRQAKQVEERDLLEDLERAELHLAQVFHRFLAGDARQVKLSLNGHRIVGWDPFLESHEATIKRPQQRLASQSGQVEVRGFILPHRDRFRSSVEFDKAGGPAGWNAQQGLYIYRNKRLLTAGGWGGLGGSRAWTREESSRLGRVRVDIPNSADSDWNIDIRKSVARPPPQVRARLSAIAQDVRRIARDVFVHRGEYGSRPRNADVQKVWGWSSSPGSSAYRVQRDHPAVVAARPARGESRAAFDALLVLIERTVPIDRIWLDVSENAGSPAIAPVSPDSELLEAAKSIVVGLVRMGMTRADAIARVAKLDPYDSDPDFEQRLTGAIRT
jgi:hypothetical protein